MIHDRVRRTLPAQEHFASFREFARVSAECAKQAFATFPFQATQRLVLDSGLDSAWNKERVGDMIADGLQDLQDKLGPAYQPLFTKILKNLQVEREPMAATFEEITIALNRSVPEWSHDFIVERSPLFISALFQVHAAVDEKGGRWFFKIIKPSARVKLESSIKALREIESALKPLAALSIASSTLKRIEELRRSFQRDSDLRIERRMLQRMRVANESDGQAALTFPRVHERFGDENLFVFERLEGFPLNLEALNWKVLESSKKLNWSAQPIQASVLKAFELGLIRSVIDTEKLVMMRDGAVGVRYGWSHVMADGSHRSEAATLLKALYINDYRRMSDLLSDSPMLRNHRHRAKANPAENGIAQKLSELSGNGKTYNFVELAELTYDYSKSLGIELPKGFVDIAKSLHSLEGVGKPLVVKRSVVSIASFGFPIKPVAHEIALNSPIARARRLTRR